jgi:hypothetical protein
VPAALYVLGGSTHGSVATCGDPQKLIDAISHSDALAPGLSDELVDYRCVAGCGYAHVFAKSVGSASVILQAHERVVARARSRVGSEPKPGARRRRRRTRYSIFVEPSRTPPRAVVATPRYE